MECTLIIMLHTPYHDKKINTSNYLFEISYIHGWQTAILSIKFGKHHQTNIYFDLIFLIVIQLKVKYKNSIKLILLYIAIYRIILILLYLNSCCIKKLLNTCFIRSY